MVINKSLVRGSDIIAVLTIACTLFVVSSAQASVQFFFNGFETDTSGWNVYGGTNDATRVPSGTNGITAATGSFYGVAAGPYTIEIAPKDGSAATDWGNPPQATFGNGFTSKLDIYLKFGTTNDTRFDWDTAINDSSGGFLQDNVFNAGFYNNTDATGSGDRFVISASNNAGRSGAFPENPGRDPFAITQEGWYTFVENFYDAGGVLAADLSILDSLGTLLHTWTLPDGQPIGTVGGAAFGWVVDNEFDSLAIDNSELDLTGAAAGAIHLDGLVGFGNHRCHDHLATIAAFCQLIQNSQIEFVQVRSWFSASHV